MGLKINKTCAFSKEEKVRFKDITYKADNLSIACGLKNNKTWDYQRNMLKEKHETISQKREVQN